MKVVYIECSVEEMRANRTFMDALTDIVDGIVSTFNSPISDELENELNEESEE